MLSQSLQQKLLQKLSPQQIQLIKLLEVPTIQLEQRIKKEIEENPVLEEGADEGEDGELSYEDGEDADIEMEDDKQIEEFTLEDYLNDEDETPSYKLNANNYSKDDKKTEVPYSVGFTFHEHMESQLGLRIMSEHQHTLAVRIEQMEVDPQAETVHQPGTSPFRLTEGATTDNLSGALVRDAQHDIPAATVGYRAGILRQFIEFKGVLSLLELDVLAFLGFQKPTYFGDFHSVPAMAFCHT